MTKTTYTRPSNHDLMMFGVVMCGALFVLSLLVTTIGLWLHGGIGWTKIYVLNGIGVILFLLPGLVYPPVLAPVHKYWMKFGMALGRVNSVIILSLIWYLVFTPVSVIQKIIGRDPLSRKLSKDEPTYWWPRESREDRRDHFERQF